MFRADLHLWFERMLSQGKTPIERAVREEAERLLTHAGPLVRWFSVIELTQGTFAWSYRAPSGHHMAAAARWANPRTAPFVADQWTWDAANPPTLGPWASPLGWTRWEGSPATPNWRFDGFYTG